MRFEIYADASGKYRWRLRELDGRVIASGAQSFATAAAARIDAELIRARAGASPVEELP